MSGSVISTEHLQLVPQTPEHLCALIQGTAFYTRSFGYVPAAGLRDFFVSKDVSADFLERLPASTLADPWTHGFAVVHRDSSTVIGSAGFKGPPSTEGVVEIAYAIVPGYEGKGYATEAANALVGFAVKTGRVQVIRAHTLPVANASTRVLTKCGFKHIGEFLDAEDGLVWRWQKKHEGS
jgi:[ribosomal protein S5]-alanine N-acetyltransferase